MPPRTIASPNRTSSSMRKQLSHFWKGRNWSSEDTQSWRKSYCKSSVVPGFQLRPRSVQKCTHALTSPGIFDQIKQTKKACIFPAKFNINTCGYYMHPHSISDDKAGPIWIVIKDISKKYLNKIGTFGVLTWRKCLHSLNKWDVTSTEINKVKYTRIPWRSQIWLQLFTMWPSVYQISALKWKC